MFSINRVGEEQINGMGEMVDATAAPELVARLVTGWEAKDVTAICACLAEDAVWHNMPHAPIQGRDTIGAAIASFLASVGTVTFHVHNQGAIGPGLFVNERTDSFRMADGRDVHLPVMGIFQIRDGLIDAWRDYFDAAAMSNQKLRPSYRRQPNAR